MAKGNGTEEEKGEDVDKEVEKEDEVCQKMAFLGSKRLHQRSISRSNVNVKSYNSISGRLCQPVLIQWRFKSF